MPQQLLITLLLAVLFFGAIGEAASPSSAVASECVSFNPANANASNLQGAWIITDGNTSLDGFGSNKAEVDRALAIIGHYGMNERCVVGRPDLGFQYWLVDGQAPSGALSGEACMSFDPHEIQVKQADENWKIVEDGNQILNFKEELDTRAIHRVIQNYGFTRLCFVGRPHPTFVYLRR